VLPEVPKISYSIPLAQHVGIKPPRSPRVLVTEKLLTRMRVATENGIESSLDSFNFYESIYVHV
jgi:hypothetical protein